MRRLQEIGLEFVAAVHRHATITRELELTNARLRELEAEIEDAYSAEDADARIPVHVKLRRDVTNEGAAGEVRESALPKHATCVDVRRIEDDAPVWICGENCYSARETVVMPYYPTSDVL